MSNPIDFRTRMMALMVYGTEEEIDMFLALNNYIILHFAYICHDRDVDANGDPIEPHFHLCLNLRSDYYISDILNKIKEITHQNAMGECLGSKGRFYNYLLHKGKPNKYQYSKDLIVTDNGAFWLDPKETANNLVYDIIAGADTAYLLKEYGNLYVFHADQYHSLASKIMREQNLTSSSQVSEIVEVNKCQRDLDLPDGAQK